MTGPTREFACKGCITLGTACMKCARCCNELREQLEAAEAAKFRVVTERNALQVALTEARAREAAAWEAGRVLCNEIGTVGASRHIWWAISQFRAVKPTDDTDATAALTAVKDAEWNAALEAVRKGLMIENGSRGDYAIRALRRNPKEGV